MAKDNTISYMKKYLLTTLKVEDYRLVDIEVSG